MRHIVTRRIKYAALPAGHKTEIIINICKMPYIMPATPCVALFGKDELRLTFFDNQMGGPVEFSGLTHFWKLLRHKTNCCINCEFRKLKNAAKRRVSSCRLQHMRRQRHKWQCKLASFAAKIKSLICRFRTLNYLTCSNLAKASSS